jgi:hypothetical protein
MSIRMFDVVHTKANAQESMFKGMLGKQTSASDAAVPNPSCPTIRDVSPCKLAFCQDQVDNASKDLGTGKM